MYKQRVKNNWGRIVSWFTQANGGITLEDIPEKVEAFAWQMFKEEEPEMAEQEQQITLRDRLRYAFS